ncbi:coiled-coil domain-containing protein 122 [Triplophysa dalaica]|uniref:coiled-coil domain-containing protein 122 n=1 Tax=Triplophysa dalaica TaxID=1582913 RepID=UPI0024DF9099|nr:coiled-coil domain-containing protein 122 [Triplophysa dalaica]
MSTDREQKFPLCETLHDAIHQGASRARELTHKQHTLHTLQVSLSEMEQRCRLVYSDLQQKERNISVVLCDTENLQNNITSLETQIHNILLENLQLRHSIEEQSENFRSSLAGYTVYRTKLEMFKESVCEVERQTDVYKQLKEKELHVSKLKQTLDELKHDLQNPEGKSVVQAQKEINLLQANIRSSRQTARVRKAHLKREREAHTQLRKDTEIENRRCDAIMKRLHCQLKKVQSQHRRLSTDVTDMKKELEDLKSQQTARS